MRYLTIAILTLGLTGPALAEGAMPDAKTAPAAKSFSVKLDGKVKSPASFSLADLKALPAVTIQTNYAGQSKESWTGASLMAILDKAGTVEEGRAGAYLQHLILARGTDGYAAGIAIGEIDAKFEGKQAIIAYAKDGAPLDSLRLIVPGDTHAGRSVRDLNELTVQ